MQNSHNILKIILIIIITACVTASSVRLLFCQKPEISQPDDQPVAEENMPIPEENAPTIIEVEPLSEENVVMVAPPESTEEPMEPQLPENITMQMYATPAD